jgi:hypothetical protein
LSAFDAYIVKGQRAFMETRWLPALDNRSTVVIQAMETGVSPGCAVSSPTSSRVPPREYQKGTTAFGLRRDHVLVEILATFADRSNGERVAKSYAPNAERLIKAKRQYDPDNVLCSAIPLPVSQDSMAGISSPTPLEAGRRAPCRSPPGARATCDRALIRRFKFPLQHDPPDTRVPNARARGGLGLWEEQDGVRSLQT